MIELNGAKRIVEPDAICELLEDLLPEIFLRPADTMELDRAHLIGRFADLYVINWLLAGALGAMMPLPLARQPVPLDRVVVDSGGEAIGRALDAAASAMDSSGRFAMGIQPTIADGALVLHLIYVECAGALLDRPDLFSSRPLLSDYLDGVAGLYLASRRCRD